MSETTQSRLGKAEQTAEPNGPTSTPAENLSSSAKTQLSDTAKNELAASLLGGGELPGDPELDQSAQLDDPEGQDQDQEGADEAQGGAQEADGGAGRGGVPKSLKELAERLEIDAAELYGLEIGTGDGESVTLGAMKDAWQTRAAAEQETADRAAELDGREAEIIADRQAWITAAEYGKIPKDAVNGVRELMSDHRQREERILLQLRPELSDPDAAAGVPGTDRCSCGKVWHPAAPAGSAASRLRLDGGQTGQGGGGAGATDAQGTAENLATSRTQQRTEAARQAQPGRVAS